MWGAVIQHDSCCSVALLPTLPRWSENAGSNDPASRPLSFSYLPTSPRVLKLKICVYGNEKRRSEMRALFSVQDVTVLPRCGDCGRWARSPCFGPDHVPSSWGAVGSCVGSYASEAPPLGERAVRSVVTCRFEPLSPCNADRSAHPGNRTCMPAGLVPGDFFMKMLWRGSQRGHGPSSSRLPSRHSSCRSPPGDPGRAGQGGGGVVLDAPAPRRVWR